jgi:hypothetical protein
LVFIVEPARVVCVEKMTGKALWTSAGSDPADYAGLLAAPTNGPPWSLRPLKYGEHGGATYASPVTDGKRLWLKLANRAVCMDLADGKQSWATPLNFAPGDHPHCVPSPLLIGGVLVCQGGDSEYWRKNSTNVIASGILPPNPTKGKFWQWMAGLDAETGKILWDIGPLNGSEYGLAGTPGPLVLDDGKKKRHFAVSHEGQVVDVQTGKLAIPFAGGRAGSTGATPLGNRMWFKSRVIEFGLGPDGNPCVVKTVKLEGEGGAYHNGRFYCGSRAPDKHTRLLSVLDADWGKTLYGDLRIGPVGGLKTKDSKVDGSWDYPKPAVAGKFVYLCSTHTVGVADISGKRPWPVALNAVERMHVAPVFDGERTYLRTYDALYCVARKGEEGARYEREVNARTLLDFLSVETPVAPAKGGATNAAPAKAEDPAKAAERRRTLIREASDRLRMMMKTLSGTPEARQAEALLKSEE